MSENQTLNTVSISVEHKEVKFNFRKTGTEKQVDPETGAEKVVDIRRAPITLDKLPVPNINGVIAIIKAGAADNATPEAKRNLEFLLEVVADAVVAGARDIITNDESISSSANFPYAKLEWTELAKVTTQERRSSAIPQEVWTEFLADWAVVMSARGLKAEAIERQQKILKARFSPLRQAKQLLENFKKGMAVYATSTQRLEDFADIVELLNTKLDEYLKVDVASDETFQF